MTALNDTSETLLSFIRVIDTFGAETWGLRSVTVTVSTLGVDTNNMIAFNKVVSSHFIPEIPGSKLKITSDIDILFLCQCN